MLWCGRVLLPKVFIKFIRTHKETRTISCTKFVTREKQTIYFDIGVDRFFTDGLCTVNDDILKFFTSFFKLICMILTSCAVDKIYETNEVTAEVGGVGVCCKFINKWMLTGIHIKL